MYEDSIMHLSENFIRKVLEVQENFLKRPDDVAMMVYSLSDALQKLGVDIMKTFFESIDQCQNTESACRIISGELVGDTPKQQNAISACRFFPGELEGDTPNQKTTVLRVDIMKKRNRSE